MKFTVVLVCGAIVALTGASISTGSEIMEDGAIKDVVTLLKKMLATSKTEGDTERAEYTKFKCSCDDNKEAKTKTIEESDEKISLLQSSIEKLLGLNGVLSSECGQLKASLEENEVTQNEATAIRTKSHESFIVMKKDMELAINQSSLAIETLAEVGNDQTVSDGAADNKKFMAGYGSQASLLSLETTVKRALHEAAAFVTSADQKRVVTRFVQAPFTGSYTAQSVEVIGIIKNMRETFVSNLEAATTKEKSEVTLYNAFMETKTNEANVMKASYQKKQKELSTYDNDLSTKRGLLTSAQEAKTQAEVFLDEMMPICEEKAAAYKKRNQMREDEEAAITSCISILKSDAAFAKSGSVSATTFVQLASIQRHESEHTTQDSLVEELRNSGSMRVASIATLIKGGNPFVIIMKKIEEMVKVIDDEHKADQEKLDFCNSELSSKNSDIDQLTTDIQELSGEISDQTDTIGDETSGLVKQIADTEDELKQNEAEQVEAKAKHEKATAEHHASMLELEETEDMLKKAIEVLKAYYANLEHQLQTSFLQKSASHREMPTGADFNMKGQSKDGYSAIGLLEYIQNQTALDKQNAIAEFSKDEEAYKQLVQVLKKSQEKLQEDLISSKRTLAATKKAKQLNEQSLADTQKDKAATEAYVADIKAGCDFIIANFGLRTASRDKEKGALAKCKDLIKKMPLYQSAKANADLASLGHCKGKCKNGDETETLACKACMAGVSEPAYAAGHPEEYGF